MLSSVNKISGYFIWLTNQEITMYFTNYFLVESLFLYLRLIWLDVRWGKCFCWSSVCFLQCRLVAFFSESDSSWLNIVFLFGDIFFSLSLAEYPSLSNAIVFSFKKFSSFTIWDEILSCIIFSDNSCAIGLFLPT
jgi:hypothetical protein